MAECIPNRFPAHKENDPKLWAEKQVYKALCEGLPDDYLVLYSAAWMGPGKGGHTLDSEIDFLVVHETKGILVLEVKGGGISYDASQDQWFSYSNASGHVKIKDPYEQAKRNKYKLLDRLRKTPGWVNGHVVIGHGTVFPASSPAKGYVSASFPAELTAFSEDLPTIRKKVEGMLSFWAGEQPDAKQLVGKTGKALIKKLFAQDIEHKVPLLSVLNATEEKIIQLTEQQYAILDLLKLQRRAIIEGGAGTGKTVLALEKARRLGADGFRTRLVCFNAGLGTYLEKNTEKMENVEGGTFHKFALSLCKEAKLWEGAPPDTPEFYKSVLPKLMLESLDRLDYRYDTIIVDEGQDFESNWWLPLQYALSDPDDGILYIFRDEYQNVSGSQKKEYPFESNPFSLSQNLRNTRQIFEFARKYIADETGLVAAGPESDVDVEVVRIANKDRDLVSAVSKALHRLVQEGKVSLQDVVVLTGRNQKSSRLNGVEKAGQFHLSFGQEKPNHAYVETIRRFKGLERTAVIVVETEEIRSNHALMYVALTRARSYLIVIE